MTQNELKAVALRYPDWADAPYISAKASGELVKRMLKIAEENDVPVVENAEMAEVLSIQNIGQYIPEETYSAIAMVFAFIAKLG
ncbi:MAG: EscU/YscU/HrcU family type III secretion system export apparatus switch protein [Treponema sp.]|nr:EscU/YscU/HrcU family type III secretion system export apparatus switch protein [Candidatus Treponema equifaecale]